MHKKWVIGFVCIFFVLLTFVLAANLTGFGGNYISSNNLTRDLNFTHLIVNDSSIILYAPFDRNQTAPLNLTYDYSNYSNDGLFTQGPFNNKVFWNSTGGPYGGSYVWRNVFNGFGDETALNFTTITGNTTLRSRNFTISFWGRFDEAVGAGTTRQTDVLGFWRSTTAGRNGTWCIQTDTNGQLFFASRNSSGGSTSSSAGAGSTMTQGSWFNYIAIANTNTGVIQHFFNGVNTANASVPADDYNNVTLPFLVGSCRAGVSLGWNGSIDEVLLYNRTISASEAIAIYNNQSARFAYPGEARFDNLQLNDTTTVNFLNITVNLTNNYGSKANITLIVGSSVNGAYSYGTEKTHDSNSNQFTGVPITGNNASNVSIKFLFYGTQFSDYLETFFLQSYLGDSTAPVITVNTPTSGQAYAVNDLPVILNVTLDESASVVYAVLNGDNSTNYTFSNYSSLGWNYTFTTLLTNGSYHVRFFAYDTLSNINSSVTTTFSVQIPPVVINITGPFTGFNATSNATSNLSQMFNFTYDSSLTSGTTNLTLFRGTTVLKSAQSSGLPSSITLGNVSYGSYVVNATVANANGFKFYASTTVYQFKRPMYLNLRNNSNIFWNKVAGNTTSNRSYALFSVFGDSITTRDGTWTFVLRDRLEENTTGAWSFGYNALANGFAQTGTSKSRFTGYITVNNASWVNLTATNLNDGSTVSINDSYAIDGIHTRMCCGGRMNISVFGNNVTVFYMTQPNGGLVNVTDVNNTYITSFDTNVSFREARNITFSGGAANDSVPINLTFSLVGADVNNPMWTQLNGIVTEDGPNNTGVRFDRLGRSGQDIMFTNRLNDTAFNTTLNRLNPDMVMIQFDDNFVTYLPPYYNNVTQLIRKVKAAVPNAGIVLVTHHNWTRAIENETEIYINMSFSENVGFINFFDLYTQDQINDSGWFADSIHFTSAGGSVFGNYTWSLLQQENTFNASSDSGSSPGDNGNGGGGGGGGGGSGGSFSGSGQTSSGTLNSFETEFSHPFNAGQNNTIDVYTYDTTGHRVTVDSVMVNFTDYPLFGLSTLSLVDTRYMGTFFVVSDEDSRSIHFTVSAKKGNVTIEHTYEAHIASVEEQESSLLGLVNGVADSLKDRLSARGPVVEVVIIALSSSIILYVSYLVFSRVRALRAKRALAQMSTLETSTEKVS